MKSKSLRVLAAGCLLGGVLMFAPSSASAAPMYDFSDVLSGAEGYLAGKATSWTSLDGVVTVTGFADYGTGFVEAPLWVRNSEPNDNGFGVCSANETCVSPGGGDTNELSQLTDAELIVVTLASGWVWDSLWVSSLDANGTDGGENGGVNGGASTQFFNTSTALGCPGGGCGSDEGTLPDGFWKNNSFALTFFPGVLGQTGNNEDYLVWGVNVAEELNVPEPATLSLFGLGLIAVGARMRRRRHEA